jgi:hypothetical protein
LVIKQWKCPLINMKEKTYYTRKFARFRNVVEVVLSRMS